MRIVGQGVDADAAVDATGHPDHEISGYLVDQVMFATSILAARTAMVLVYFLGNFGRCDRTAGNLRHSGCTVVEWARTNRADR
jgi:hypothetical protein